MIKWDLKTEIIKCLCDEIKWGKWGRYCDIASGYHWPICRSEGGSSASGLRLSEGN